MSGGKAGDLFAHAVLGAVVAELQGNSGIVGGASAVSGELAVPIIQKALYGDRGIKNLTEEEKENLSALTQLAIGLTIASMGGDCSDIVAGVNSSKNAVENNYLFAPEDKERKDAQAKLNLINEGLLVVSDKEKQELEGQVAILNALDAQRDEILNIACQNLSSSECNALRIELQLAYESYFKTLSPEDYLAYNDAYANYTKYYDGYKKILSQLTELEGRDLAAYNEYKAQNLSDGLGISIESARNLVKFDNAMHSTAMLAAMVVGPNSIAGKGTNANKPLNKTDLEHQYGKGNVEQGGGNYKETKDNIYDNQITNQKANESSNFGEHVKNEKALNNKPLDKDYFESEYGKGNVQQGGGNYKETKDKIHDNQITNQKGNSSSKFDEHIKNEQDINANLGKRPEDKIWSETNKKSPVTNAYDHWDKHKHEFPEFQNSKQYVDATHNFVRNPPTGTLTKVRKNGDTVFYNPQSNIFAVKNADGTPRTMFKPNPADHGYKTNLEYFNAQK